MSNEELLGVWTDDTVEHKDRPESTNVAYVAFHHRLKRLLVGFRNGAVYTYEPASHETFKAIADAPSAGKAVHHHLRKAPPDTYTVTRLSPPVLATKVVRSDLEEIEVSIITDDDEEDSPLLTSMSDAPYDVTEVISPNGDLTILVEDSPLQPRLDGEPERQGYHP